MTLHFENLKEKSSSHLHRKNSINGQYLGELLSEKGNEEALAPPSIFEAGNRMINVR